MKKILTRTLTLLIAVVLVVGTFSGCGLITTDMDRDMNQVVASISIGNGTTDENRPAIHKDYILKKEIVSGYMSYGYYYVQSYGYTTSSAYAMVLERLVQSNVIVQQAKIKLAEYYLENKDKTDLEGFAKDYIEAMKANEKASSAAKAEEIYNGGKTEAEYTKMSKAGEYAKMAELLEVYLSEYEIAQAKYSVRQNISSMIESYKEAEDVEDDEKETISVTARTAPTTEEHNHESYESALKAETAKEYDKKVVAAAIGENANKAEIEALTNEYELNLYLYKNYQVDLADKDNRTALNKAIKQLKKNGVIGKNESYNNSNIDDVMKYSYFAYMLKSQYESVIVSKYENSLKAQSKSSVTGEALKGQIIAEYNSQKQAYLSNYASYETALEAATEEKGVYCNPYEGYGYVLNLLIGFSEEQSELLKELNSKPGISNSEIKANRVAMLAKLNAKDQRVTWVQSSYGTAKENNGFAFEDKYLLSGTEALNSFIGQAIVNKEFEDKDDAGVEKTSYSFKNVYADEIPFATFKTDYLTLAGIDNFTEFVEGGAVAKIAGYSEENEKVFKDLLYAFSTDPGCLGKDFGYLYSPKTSATTYVPEFAAAAKAVVEAGVGAYTIVATDYGYHVILCSKVVEKDGDNTEEIINAIMGNEEYNEVKVDSVLSDVITKISNKMVNEYIKKADYVKEAYSDLIEDADDPAKSNK